MSLWSTSGDTFEHVIPYILVIVIELFHGETAKCGGGNTSATSLHAMFSTVWSL